MAVGPFARLIVQLGIVIGGAVTRAVIQAYKDAAQRGLHSGHIPKTLRRRMSIEEASRILEIDVTKTTSEELQTRFARLHEINTPSENFSGSPYLQKKVENARIVIEEDIFKLKPRPSSLSNSSTSYSSDSSPPQSQFSSFNSFFRVIYPFSRFQSTNKFYPFSKFQSTNKSFIVFPIVHSSLIHSSYCDFAL